MSPFTRHYNSHFPFQQLIEETSRAILWTWGATQSGQIVSSCAWKYNIDIRLHSRAVHHVCVYVFSPLKKQISYTEKVIRTVSGIKPSIVVTYCVYHAQEFVPAFRVTGASEHTGNRRYPQVNPFADFISNAFPLAHQVLWKAQVLETDMPRFGFWFPPVLTLKNAPALSTPPVISSICASQPYWNDFSWAVWGKRSSLPLKLWAGWLIPQSHLPRKPCTIPDSTFPWPCIFLTTLPGDLDLLGMGVFPSLTLMQGWDSSLNWAPENPLTHTVETDQGRLT